MEILQKQIILSDTEILEIYNKQKEKYRQQYLKRKAKQQENKTNDEKLIDIEKLKNLKFIQNLSKPKKDRGRPKGTIKSYKMLYFDLLNQLKNNNSNEPLEPIINEELEQTIKEIEEIKQ